MSVEVVEYSLICLEDLDIGTGTRSVHLADGSTVTLHQIPLGLPGSSAVFLTLVTQTTMPGAGLPTVVLTGMIPAGARVAGITTEILTSLGTSQGLTSMAVGDSNSVSRWGTQTVLSQGAQTDQGDFESSDWPIYAGAADVILSALGGLFDGVGQVEVTVHYFLLTHRSA